MEHNEEQQDIGKYRKAEPQAYVKGNWLCLLSVHVGGTKGAATKKTADSALKRFNDSVGQREANYDSFLHTGLQHESSSGSNSITPIDASPFVGNDEEAECDTQMREAYMSGLGAVAWAVLTKAEVAVYVQALQLRAHAQPHKGLYAVESRHPTYEAT